MCRRTLISHFSALLVLLGSIVSVIAQTAPQSRPEQERPRLESRGKKGDDDQRPTPGQPQPQSQTDESGTIKIDTTLVTIPVSVLDRDGKYVPNLSKRDFQIYEDGVQQEIADFSLVEVPFNVVLLLDTSRSTVFRLEDIQHAAVAFVEQLRPQDRVMVVSFDDKIYIDSEFTSDRARLRRAIYGTRTGGGTKLYDAVDLVITERLNRMDGRKAIVLFTDGVDTTS
jgi:VWFA-related protein